MLTARFFDETFLNKIHLSILYLTFIDINRLFTDARFFDETFLNKIHLSILFLQKPA